MVAVLIRAEGYLTYGNADISGGRVIKRWVQRLDIYGGSSVGLNTWSCVHHGMNSELFRLIQDRVATISLVHIHWQHLGHREVDPSF